MLILFKQLSTVQQPNIRIQELQVGYNFIPGWWEVFYVLSRPDVLIPQY